MLKRLEVKIIVSLALILTVMIAVYGWWTGSRQQTIYVQALSDNLRVLAHSLADNAAGFIVTQEYAGLEAHMMNAAQMPDVVTIRVAEPDGHVLCNIERPSRGLPARINYEVHAVTVPREPKPALSRQGDQLVSWAPISAGTHLGWVRMALTLETANQLQLATWRSSLQIGALWILVGTLLMFMVVKRPLRAIRELSLFAQDLQHSKGAQVAVRRGVYEIDMLADALNHSSTQLRDAEQRLIAEQERLTITLQSIGDGVIATDTDNRIVLLNQVAETLTGWSEVEARQRLLEEVLQLDGETGRTEVMAGLRHVIDARRTLELPGQHTLVSKDGAKRTVTVNGAPIINSSGELGGMVLVIHDITEQARIEAEKLGLAQQLIQSQKMEAVGQLAGGVAHDFNNMLGVIIGHAELAMLSADPSGQMHERLKEIHDAATRSADITKQLLAFSRQQHAEPKVLDLNETIARMLKMLHRLIGEDIDLSWSPGFDLWKVKLDPSQLDQVMANLCVNARDAIVGVGKIEIFTENVKLGQHEQARMADLMPGDYVMLVVADSGQGMTREVIERIFEPFYTTKELGRGTGLGLATVFGIVKQNSGHIEVASTPGHGTTFRIYLPAVHEVAQQADPKRERPVGGTETILLVEDEPAIMEIGTTILTQLGYTVYPAASPEQAIAIAADGSKSIDLLLTDIIMPGMNGRDLSERLLVNRPDLKCLFMSGYTADVIAGRGKVEEGMCFLQKPFTMQSLAAKVRDALAAA
ncbi:ATP-binding protein [Geomonas azotofigens]|uniref:ATP-binding protein n=1 Tax=Geomonas azotofigens TaxID=2843196 RepID=UPI001C0FD377|nr:PAS domain-containing sensor histidine kinase [Geomonas azotofigens]MBU5613967.1 response regulator [Geomonas azotofigens]